MSFSNPKIIHNHLCTSQERALKPIFFLQREQQISWGCAAVLRRIPNPLLWLQNGSPSAGVREEVRSKEDPSSHFLTQSFFVGCRQSQERKHNSNLFVTSSKTNWRCGSFVDIQFRNLLMLFGIFEAMLTKVFRVSSPTLCTPHSPH